MIKIKLELSNTLDQVLKEAIEETYSKPFDQRIQDTVKDLKDATPVDTGYAQSRWKSYKQNSLTIKFSFKNPFLFKLIDSQHIIDNDADYIQYLNAGWSKQAPAFFVEQTLISNGFQPNVKSG